MQTSYPACYIFSHWKGLGFLFFFFFYLSPPSTIYAKRRPRRNNSWRAVTRAPEHKSDRQSRYATARCCCCWNGVCHCERREKTPQFGRHKAHRARSAKGGGEKRLFTREDGRTCRQHGRGDGGTDGRTHRHTDTRSLASPLPYSEQRSRESNTRTRSEPR